MFQSPRRHCVSVSLDLFKFFSRFGNLRVCHSICSSFSAASALCHSIILFFWAASALSKSVTRSVQVSQPLRLCVSQSECVTRSSLKITEPVELSVSERISLFRLHFEVEVSYKSLSKRSSSDASSGKIDGRKFSDRLSRHLQSTLWNLVMRRAHLILWRNIWKPKWNRIMYVWHPYAIFWTTQNHTLALVIFRVV